MGQVRINELGRELEIKSKLILEYLPQIGISEKKSHSSSIEDEIADQVRAHFRAVEAAEEKAAREEAEAKAAAGRAAAERAVAERAAAERAAAERAAAEQAAAEAALPVIPVTEPPPGPIVPRAPAPGGAHGRPGPVFVQHQRRSARTQAAALLFGLGRAQVAILPVHQVPEAFASLRRAFDYYAGVGNVAQAVAVAECPPPIVAGVVTGARELTERALTLVSRDSLEAARLLSLHGRLLGLEAGDLSGAREALREALEIAERTGDPVLQMRTLVDGADVDVYHGDWGSGLNRALRAVELAPRANDPRSEMLAHYWAALPLALVAGEPERAAATPPPRAARSSCTPTGSREIQHAWS